MKNAKINGVWVDVPGNKIDIESWLNQHVGYLGFEYIDLLEPGNPILRKHIITHVRKNGRGKGVLVSNIK